MPRSDKQLSSEDRPTQNRSGRTGAVFIIFTILVLAYAFVLVREQAEPTSSATNPLPVRTDLMRDQPCHVANQVVMGNCSDEEIAALQRQARLLSSP